MFSSRPWRASCWELANLWIHSPREKLCAMPNGVKTRFAGLLRELLRRFDENETGADTPQPPRPVTQAATPPPVPIPQFTTPQPKPAARAATSAPAPVENINEVELPLQPILGNLPPQLHARLTLTDADLSRASISIAIGKIMPQLALGVVKITFGELRHAAPTLFNVDEEYDSLPVILPLNEVLARLNFNSLARNPGQKHLEVPAEITGPFNGRGEGIMISKAAFKPPPPAAPQIRMATPPPRAPADPTPPPVAPPPPAFVSRAIKPESPAPALSRNGNGNGLPAQPIIPGIPVQPPPTMPPAPRPTPFTPRPTPFTPRSTPFTPKPAPVAPESATILAPLAALSENWPEALRMEIAQMNLANAQVALPVNLVEPALKRGRVMFAWRNLRSWIKPTSTAVSIHDGLELELPLKIVAPLFLARLGRSASSAHPHQSAPLPVEIPNLFFGFPQPQPSSEIPEPPGKTATPDGNRFAARPADPQPQDTNYYTWGESDTTSLVARPGETEFKRPVAVPAMPATDFSSRRAPPDEIVLHAMKLPGVAGALVALPDGLTVASQIPPDLNADTLAAFLPQIYGRVSQCTKELRMGELNNLNFTVGNVPWKVFRIHGVYFAAFGRAGELLPTAQLALLAGELDRKKQ